MNPAQIGAVTLDVTKAAIIKDLIQHSKIHYKICDEEKLRSRFDKLNKLEIEDFATDQGAFHDFFITTNSRFKRHCFGLGEHGSNMKADYEIEIIIINKLD